MGRKRGTIFTVAFFLLMLVLNLVRVRGVAGVLSGYILVSFLPGYAICTLLFGKPAGAVDSFLRAGVLSPLVCAAVAAVAILSGLDFPAALVMTSVLSMAVLAIAGLRKDGAGYRSPGDWKVLALIAALTLLVAVPLIVNPVLRIRSDAWFHAAVSESIARGGIPPGDPYYAGVQLRYFWAYHLYLLLLRTACGGSLFDHMAAVNVIFFALYLCAVFRFSARVSGRRSGPWWAVLLAVFGINIMGWVLVAGRAFFGRTSGLGVLDGMLGTGVYNALQSLSLGYAGSLAFFLDKFLVGSSFAMSLAMFTLMMHAVLGWLRAGDRRELFLAGLCTASAVLFHTVVGLSILLCGAGALLAAAFLSRRRDEGAISRRSFAAFLILIVTAIACTPYLRTILSAGNTVRENPFTFNGIFLWTVIAAGILPLLLCGVRLFRGGAAGWGERFVLCWIGAVMVLGAFARMPLGNVNKFVYLVFLPLIALAGDGMAALVERIGRRRIVRYAVSAALAFSAAATFSFAWSAYVRDPGVMDVPPPFAGGRVEPAEAEREVYRWIREATPADAVFINGDRTDIPVLAGRSQLWTAGAYPEVWGYDEGTIRWRGDLARTCYAGRPIPEEARKALSRLGVSVYCVVRPEDDAPDAADDAENILNGLYRKVFSNETFVIFEIFP